VIPTALASSDTNEFCDHTSVGILISCPRGLLVFERATSPHGISPVAGHIDQHGGPEQAARAEVAEEVGLTVVRLQLLLDQWRPNRCRRAPTGPAVGHHWWIFRGEVSGEVYPSTREVREPRWANPDRLQQLASRTVAHACGHLSRHEFEQQPGLEPVWCRFLHSLGFLALPPADLDLIEEIL
jgi:8-oxo-dGTP pyrophosphatase MutT (NUDIX family)